MGLVEKGRLPKPLTWLLNYSRKYSLWMFQWGLACCAIEMGAALASPRYDVMRLGVIPFPASPRQADLVVISGTVTDKMAPAIKRLYEQMPDPKYVISMGACANCGGPYWDSYSVTEGRRPDHPGRRVHPGLPAAPRSAAPGDRDAARSASRTRASATTRWPSVGAVSRTAKPSAARAWVRRKQPERALADEAAQQHRSEVRRSRRQPSPPARQPMMRPPRRRRKPPRRSRRPNRIPVHDELLERLRGGPRCRCRHRDGRRARRPRGARRQRRVAARR